MMRVLAAAESPTMAPQLTHLPPELLQTVFQFAGSDAKTLLNVEKLCRKFRQVVSVNATWKFVPTVCRFVISTRGSKLSWKSRKVDANGTDFLGCLSHRMRACLCQSFAYMRAAQKSGSSFYESILDPEEWSGLVQGALVSHSNRVGLGDLEDDTFILRSDTMCVLGEIAQTAMISLLSRANSLSCTIAEATQKYPILTRMHLRHELVSQLLGLKQDFIPAGSEQAFVREATELLPDGTRTAIVHFFARKAGIVRMANDTHDLVWASFINITLMLLGPACRELMEENEKGNGKRLLASNEHPYSVPPLSKFEICADCGYPHEFFHTLVPGQIQDAAKALGLAYKVYGFPSASRNDPLNAQIEMDYEDIEEEEEDEGIPSEERSSGGDESSNDGGAADADMAEVHNEEDAESQNNLFSGGSENDAVVELDMEASADRPGDEESQATRNVGSCVIS